MKMESMQRKVYGLSLIPEIQSLFAELEWTANESLDNIWLDDDDVYSDPDNNTDAWNSTQINDTRNIDLYVMLSLYSNYQWSRYLSIYTNPILIILGTIGNFLSVLVMTRKTMIKSSTFYYMALLAVADTLVLYFACFRTWLAYLTGDDLINVNSAACKIISFLCYWSFSMAAWILVAMTIDRYVVIHLPLKVKQYSTVARAQKVILLLVILLIGFNSHFFFTVTINVHESCSPIKARKIEFIELVWPWLDATVYCILPFFILIIFNCLIIYDQHKAALRRNSLQPSVNNRNGGHSSYKSNSSRRLTVMLLTVSISFLITSSPKTILVILRPYVFNVFEDGERINFDLLSVYTLTSSIADFLLYANHSMNFFLYCISGRKFREELKRIVWQCIEKHRRAATLDMTSDSRRSSAISNLTINIHENIDSRNCDVETTHL